jgi:hypothetical protein
MKAVRDSVTETALRDDRQGHTALLTVTENGDIVTAVLEGEAITGLLRPGKVVQETMSWGSSASVQGHCMIAICPGRSCEAEG